MADEELQAEDGESEDLFGFDELFSPSTGAGEGAADVGDRLGASQDVFDEDDALFNFDELGVEADVEAAEARAAAEPEPPDESDAGAGTDTEVEVGTDAALEPIDVGRILADLPEGTEVETSDPARRGVTGRSRSSAYFDEDLELDEELLLARGYAAPSRSLRSATVWILLLFTALNLGTVGFTWRVSGKVQDQVGQATRTLIQATQEMQSRTGEHISRLQTFQSPVVVEEAQYENTFEKVRAAIERGDYAGARRRLYALLSIADRLDADIREDVEATAQFMLGDVAFAMATAPEEELP